MARSSPAARPTIAALCLLGLVATLAPHARAWSYKEHIQLTRIAAARLIADPQTPE